MDYGGWELPHWPEPHTLVVGHSSKHRASVGGTPLSVALGDLG